jgi:hypothetical protein
MIAAEGPAYVTAVVALYTDLPDTPQRASAYDRAVARAFFERAVPLDTVVAALRLGSLRRRIRPVGALPLPRIRSLAYFTPVVDEILQSPLPAGYRGYLRSKAEQLRLEVQKTTFSSDR